jgi:hypothetical protein
MAPFLGPSKQAVLERLRVATPRGFPLTVGEYAPQAVIREEDGRWVLRALVVDKERADAAYKEAQAAGGFWMPEHEFAYLVPGDVLAEGGTRAALADVLEKQAWSYGDGE